MISNDTSSEFTIKADDRGPWSIVWTCLITIFLCCWTSICINCQSAADNHWDRFRDKLNLAVFCIIGPDFIILLSVGQWESARRSVKVRLLSYGVYSHWTLIPEQEFKPITPPGKQWTMKQAYHADMGGYHLETPGYPTFPLTARQLAFLISKGYVDFPSEDETDIDDRNKRDGLARYVQSMTSRITVTRGVFTGLNC